MSSWNYVYSNNYAAGSWTEEQRANNVDIIASYFNSKGWVPRSIAAMLGNMQAESYINPGQWEHTGTVDVSGGFGLVQWTPFTKFRDWCAPQHGGMWKFQFNAQLDRIQWELENGEQWITVIGGSFYDFAHNTGDWDIDYLTEMWERNYERPASYGDLSIRQENARHWLAYLTGEPIEPWEPPYNPPDPGTTRKIPIWLLFKMKEANQ